MKRLSLLWVSLALIVGIIFVLPWVTVRVKTVAVMLNIILPDARLHPLEYVTAKPAMREEQIDLENGESMRVMLYEPASYDRVLIIYAPWANIGNENVEMNRIAATFARLGFLVAAYSRQSDADIDLPTAQTADDLVLLAQKLLVKNPEHPATSVGFFGVSIGNGPVFRAAADPRLQDSIAFIFAFSTFYDYHDQTAYLQEGQASYNGIVFTEKPSTTYVKNVTDMAARHGVTLAQLFDSPFYIRSGEEISPSISAANIRVPVYIMHSPTDRVFPYTNALKLADALKPNVPVRLLLSDLIMHGSVRKVTWQSVLHYYLPEGLNYYHFLLTFLREQT